MELGMFTTFITFWTNIWAYENCVHGLFCMIKNCSEFIRKTVLRRSRRTKTFLITLWLVTKCSIFKPIQNSKAREPESGYKSNYKKIIFGKVKLQGHYPQTICSTGPFRVLSWRVLKHDSSYSSYSFRIS